MSVTVTETAAREVANIIKQQQLDPDKVNLRVGVKGGGCSGFTYLLDLTETKKDSDEVYEFTYDIPITNEGGDTTTQKVTLRVICDPKSHLYLNGTTVDFKDELMGRGFVFNNPNASSTCGCGSSFGA